MDPGPASANFSPSALALLMWSNAGGGRGPLLCRRQRCRPLDLSHASVASIAAAPVTTGFLPPLPLTALIVEALPMPSFVLCPLFRL